MKFILKAIFKVLIRLIYRIDVRGLENIKQVNSSIIIANHTSLLDGMLIELFIPVKKLFFIDTIIAQKPLNRFFLKFVDYHTLNLSNPYALKKMLKTLKLGGNCVIFPEGRVSVTGSLMKIQNGTGLIAERGNFDLLPVWISGAVRSPLSYSRHTQIPKTFPKISLYIDKPFKLAVDPNIKGRVRREHLSMEIFDALRLACYNAKLNDLDMFENLVKSAKENGFSRPIIQDFTYTEVTYKKIILGSLLLGKYIKKSVSDKKYTGLLLPNSNAAAVTFFSLQAHGLCPAIINFSSSIDSIRATVKASDLDQIITSHKVIEVGKLEHIVEGLSDLVTFIYLEDLREKITFTDKIGALIKLLNPFFSGTKYRKNPEDTAVVIFTSGSEGLPKGVALSTKNILSNIAQTKAHLGLTPKDIIFNCLPFFHSFGLVVGTIMPLLEGIKVFMYPSPLHYSIIPQVVYDINATIIVGTDTFYAGYARKATPYDFQSIRMAVAGAEKLKESTQKIYFEKFGIRIFEGYGVSETSPVISANTEIYNCMGTVGRIICDMKYRLEPVPGFESGGKLLVKGPNVMKGYLKHDNPGVIQEKDEWYDTGDIVEIDAKRFIKIIGRAKRFVKIAGEMVSLSAVENMLSEIDNLHQHAAIPVDSDRKGQEIYLVTESETLTRKDINDHVVQNKKSALFIPRKILFMSSIPILASGKINYPEIVKQLDLK